MAAKSHYFVQNLRNGAPEEIRTPPNLRLGYCTDGFNSDLKRAISARSALSPQSVYQLLALKAARHRGGPGRRFWNMSSRLWRAQGRTIARSPPFARGPFH